MLAGKSLLRWLILAPIVVAGGVAIAAFARQSLLPFGVAMAPLDGSQMVDPRNPVTLEAIGFGARLAEVHVRDQTGKVVAQAADQPRFTFEPPLAFGTRYTLAVTVERPWFRQKQTRELSLTTVDIPQLEGPVERMLAPDASVTLRFDRPVGSLQTKGDLKLAIEPDQAHQTIRLVASDYAQGKTLPVEINWQTTTGVPLPPLHLAITTPPPLSAEITPRGQSNLGLAIPVQLTFSEPVADRENVGQHVSIRTQDGADVAGKWTWLNKTRLRFTPQTQWPASSTVAVSVDQKGLKSLQGGMMDQPLASSFSTGSDRRIFVYLDKQQVAAVENGQVVRNFRVSTGKAATPTVAGSYYIYARFPIKTMRSRAKPGQPGHYVVENVPYAQYFHADYAFHGAWWHNAFGRPASHGCVNMSTRSHNRRWPGASEDAGWLYRWASLGVPVTVFRNSPPQTQVANSGGESMPVGQPVAIR